MPNSNRKLMTILALSVVALGVISWLLLTTGKQPAKKSDSETRQMNTLPAIQINQTKIQIELANTNYLRTQGLSGRTSLPANYGMLFVFDTKSQPGFWMKDMIIPLDFIWIADNKVVDLHENIQPPAPNTLDSQLVIITPKAQINYVLEVTAGFIAKNGIEIGDSVDLSAIY